MNTGSRYQGAERGAVLIELCLVVLLLVSMVLTVVALAVMLRDQMTVSTASRAGARVGSSVSTTPLADYDVLQAVKAALGSTNPADVEKIVVFRAGGGGAMPSGCLTASVAGECNSYTGAHLALASGDFGCGGSRPDRSWCPTSRNRDLSSSAGPDWMGVYVQLRHRSAMPGFLDGRSLTSTTVMRLEPRFD